MICHIFFRDATATACTCNVSSCNTRFSQCFTHCWSLILYLLTFNDRCITRFSLRSSLFNFLFRLNCLSLRSARNSTFFKLSNHFSRKHCVAFIFDD